MRPLVLTLSFLLVGCGSMGLRPKAAVSPAVSVTDRGAVSVSGDAKVAPKVDTKQTDSALPIPEGSTFVFNEQLGTMTLTLAKASQIALKRTETAIAGPVAFEPAKQPSVGEIAEAKADFWTGIGLKAGLAIGIALAAFGLVRGWDMVMYGGISIAAACGFGIFVERHPVLLTFIGLGAGAVIVAAIVWHTKLKQLEPK